MRRTAVIAVVAALVILIATPASAQMQLKRRPNSLAAKRPMPKKFLGVAIEKISREEADKLGLDKGGLKVIDIKPGSPAANAGVRKGDVLVKLADVDLTSVKALDKALARAKLVTKLTICRDGWEKNVVVKFPRPNPKKVRPHTKPTPQGDMDRKKLIKELEESLKFHYREIQRIKKLIAELQGGEETSPRKIRPKKTQVRPKKLQVRPRQIPKGAPYLGVTIDMQFEGPGIKINSIETGSSAETGGLQKGDIILMAGGNKVADISVLKKAIAEAGVGGTLKLAVKRGDTLLNVDLTIGARK